MNYSIGKIKLSRFCNIHSNRLFLYSLSALLSLFVLYYVSSDANSPSNEQTFAASLGEWLVPSVAAESIDRHDKQYDEWRLPDVAPSPGNTVVDSAKAELGKMLFFDPRLSGNGNMSCATCHDPKNGWSDALKTALGHKGEALARATPSIINVGFNDVLMWDGRAKTLEDQALGPILNPKEMHNTKQNLLKTLNAIPGYVKAFKKAYWGLDISTTRIARSIAMFQRQIVATGSPFSKWIRGDKQAMTRSQIRGFEVFTNPVKGSCTTCHRPPNFTDHGFHNIGLLSFGNRRADLGRYNQKRAKMTRGAFKTPTLWNISQTAPYFHDGSARTLRDVVDHYMSGGRVRSNLSPNMRKLDLSRQEQIDLTNFLRALTGNVNRQLTRYTLPQ